jgi:crotonobetainyl-CoA:carnitine CoA-transferase CaiB-like acyl-CoA transferase
MKPLDGIKILDLSWVIAGPHATRILCDLGAEVIKVSSGKNPDVARTTATRRGNTDSTQEGGWMYQELNHGKLDISLNLKSERGRSYLNELVARSDAVICNYGVGAFRKLGLTFEDLSKIKKDIIVINASGLGDWGPYKDFVTYAPILQSITGLLTLVGYEGDTMPVDEYADLADYVGSLTITTYLLAALEYRRRTGHGQFVDISQGEGTSMLLGSALLNWQVNKTPPRLMGNKCPYGLCAPHNTYPCAGENAWCVISICTEAEWKTFAGCIDPEGTWSADEKFSTVAGRIEHYEEMDRQISAWTSARDKWEVTRQLQALGLSAAPVQTALECLWEDEQLQSRDFYRELRFPPSDRWPDRFPVTGPQTHIEGLEFSRVVTPAPGTGENRDEILTGLLGKTREEIEEAEREGAF